MDQIFSAFVEMFKNNYKELKMCGEKVVELKKPTKTSLVSFQKKVDAAESSLAKLFAGFQPTETDLNLAMIEKQIVAAQKVRSTCTFFSVDALGGVDKSEAGVLRTNISKLNLLLEASFKIKMLTDAKVAKAVQKFPEEDLSQIIKIAEAISLVTASINKEVSALNAQIGLILAKEMELTNRIQTFDIILSQLQKRFAQI